VFWLVGQTQEYWAFLSSTSSWASFVKQLATVLLITNYYQTEKEWKMRYRMVFVVIRAAALLGPIMLLGGCATVSPPPITENTTNLELDSSGITIVGLTLSNTFRVSPLIAPLETSGIVVVDLAPTSEEARFFFEAGKAISKSADSNQQIEEQMLSVKLAPGRYKLVCIKATVAKMAYGCAPVCADFTVTAQNIAYLGHLDITRRERKTDSEIRAGFVLPAFDQWYAGFSTGTFDVAIRDNYEHDVSTFKQRYRVLSGYSVNNTLLQR
jgi:hypothetical protein